MLQAEIKTCRISEIKTCRISEIKPRSKPVGYPTDVSQSDILPQSRHNSPSKRRNFHVYFFTCTLSDTWSAYFMRRAIAFQRICKSANLPSRVLKSWAGGAF